MYRFNQQRINAVEGENRKPKTVGSMFTREYVKLARLAVLAAVAIVLPVADGRSAGTAHPSVTVAGARPANAPAIEYQSLLNPRYYEADAGFLVDHLQDLFWVKKIDR